jgi:hypothetical protein
VLYNRKLVQHLRMERGLEPVVEKPLKIRKPEKRKGAET